MESRFGFKIDYDNMTLTKAVTLAQGITEGLNSLRRSHGAHTAEQNPKYMEMFMVREGLHRWLVENESRFITESEMAKSEAILAAKDMVDSIQDMLEKISKMQNEQLPALLDTIRDQIGSEQAESFKGTVSPLLQNLAQTLQQGRESADGAARGLAGEQQDQPMDMGGMGADAGMGGAMPPATDELGNGGGGDAFGAVDAAAGGDDELGRERRDMSEAADGRKNTAKKKCPPMSHIKKMCQDGKTVAEICKMHPDCDRTELKQMVADCKKKMDEGKGDGNLANNAKPYDKVTRGDVIAGRLGKDEKGGKKKPTSAKAR